MEQKEKEKMHMQITHDTDLAKEVNNTIAILLSPMIVQFAVQVTLVMAKGPNNHCEKHKLIIINDNFTVLA